MKSAILNVIFVSNLENRYPERGRKQDEMEAIEEGELNLENRYPERGRKLTHLATLKIIFAPFGK